MMVLASLIGALLIVGIIDAVRFFPRGPAIGRGNDPSVRFPLLFHWPRRQVRNWLVRFLVCLVMGCILCIVAAVILQRFGREALDPQSLSPAVGALFVTATGACWIAAIRDRRGHFLWRLFGALAVAAIVGWAVGLGHWPEPDWAAAAIFGAAFLFIEAALKQALRW